MSDHYRDYEESLTGKRSGGIGVLGWLMIAFFAFSAIGVGAVWMGYRFVRSQVERVVESIDEPPAALAARMLTRLDPELELVDGPEGVSTLLRNVQSGEAFDVEDLIEGSFRIRTDEGDVSMRLRGDENGGSLVIDSPEGRVSAELERDREHGSLVVRSDEGEVLRVGAGREALPLPSWMPREGGMPDAPRHLYSAATEDGTVGAVAWESERSPQRILSYYADALEDLGFESVARTHHRDGGGEQTSLWARDEDEGRMAFVVAAVEEGRTSVVLGYAEGR